MIKALWFLKNLFTQWHSITFWVSWLLGNTVLRTSNHVSFVFPTYWVVYLTTKGFWTCLWSVLVLDPFSEELLSRCQMPCDVILSCDHRCGGTCGECMQGRIHMACKEKCGKTLICGHRYWLLVNILNKWSWIADRVFFGIGFCERGPAAFPLSIINTLFCKMIHRALGWSDVICRKWTWDGELVMPAVTTSWCGNGFRAVGIATGPQTAWIGVQFPLGWAVFLLQNVYMGCAAYPAYC